MTNTMRCARGKRDLSFVQSATLTIITAAIYISLSREVQGLTFSGCFTLAPGLTVPPNVEVIGWSDKWESNSLSVRFCVNYCVDKRKKYAGIVTATKGSKPVCVCGTERAFTQLGVADHSQSLSVCQHNLWSMKTFVAYGDVSSQRVGCYKEVADQNTLASSSHIWFDKWMMSPNFCIKYCDANGASFANLKKGDTCTCGLSFAKYGRIDDSFCNKPCAGSQGERCGGDLANDVYSTTSIDEILRPGSSFVPHGFQGHQPVKVPITQTLIKNLFDLQQAIDNQVPSMDVRKVGDALFKGQGLLETVVGLKTPLQDLIDSQGFSISNAAENKAWLAFDYPPELQSFADVIKRAHTFIDVNVKKLVDQVDRFSRTAGPLTPAITETFNKLKNYLTNGLLITGVEHSVKVAQMMISSSANCLPLMQAKQALMISNLETVSHALVEGPQGTKKYIQYLKDPFSGSPITSSAAPAIDATAWKASLKEIGDKWFGFISANGIQLATLVLTPYEVCTDTVVGKNATCENSTQVDFIDLVKQPGVNEAKVDMKKLVNSAKAAFSAFDWSSLDLKLAAITRDVDLVEQYIGKIGLSSPSNIKKLQQPISSFKFARPCVDQLYDMLHKVCYTNDKPNEALVTKIAC